MLPIALSATEAPVTVSAGLTITEHQGLPQTLSVKKLVAAFDCDPADISPVVKNRGVARTRDFVRQERPTCKTADGGRNLS